ncbi:hypothetical protein CEUSTIGMA_g7261.t1 [Chlamydomonas eustigma]|uniref:RING-type domain-containing protein n=1 Tax=Chlamydomonas eustigma TaxID=1157962 RepID=A0A250X9Q3_9CHLO|nr:hypothetical protein CEUSTIGMA_g7261.t1 [Chlamydomonas eustigma]|eukprot:GAX79821.1 hypothetical protein CEUSTIGMA_g7261.t1 [Chlamydomonas eustigma]
MLFLKVAAFVATLCSFTLASQSNSGALWDQHNFPNPLFDFEACGRSVQSWICDPDHILTTESKNVSEGIIQLISDGGEPYQKAPCGSAGSKGFQVAVAVMKSFAPIKDRQIYISTGAGSSSLLTDNAIDSIIDNIKPMLRAEKYDQAVESALVDIGLALACKLSSRESEPHGLGVFLISGSVIASFAALLISSLRNGWKEQRRYNDCKAKLDKLKHDQSRLQGGQTYNPTSCPVCLEDFDVPALSRNQEEPSTSSQVAEQSEASGSADGTQAPTHEPLLGGGAKRQDFRLGAAASTRPTETTAQRIQRKPLTLPCKHTFCEICITEWIQQKKISCPVCRRPMDKETSTDESHRHARSQPPCHEEGDVDSDSGGAQRSQEETAGRAGGSRTQQHEEQQQHQQRGDYNHQDMVRDELLFRLLTLRRRYPQYVNDRMVRTWTEDIESGREISSSALREFQILNPAMRSELATSGSHGAHSSFGGGSSHGGGGRGSSW